MWSDRAPGRVQVGVSIFQCGSVSGATAERTCLWGSHAGAEMGAGCSWEAVVSRKLWSLMPGNVFLLALVVVLNV